MSDVLKSDYGKLISLYNMLTSENEVIHKILIPKIQRDYAQGREGMESVRGRFLESIFEVIDKKTPKKLMLDFVFGQKEITTRNIFYPVDGQQRLTTLYLLHLYVGKRAGETTEFLKKFSYETRISSKQFCERLNEIEAEKFSGIGGFIESQWWYTGVWRTDPTISAMINMLKDIDSHWKEMCELIKPEGAIASITENRRPINLRLLTPKKAIFAWEWMYTKSYYHTPDMQSQHEILNKIKY